jgi:two-component system, NarL family, sensor kinase
VRVGWHILDCVYRVEGETGLRLGERADDDSALDSAQRLNRYIFLGVRLQLLLRILLIAFIAATLAFEPPTAMIWICVLILGTYLAIVGCWTTWVLRSDQPWATMNRPVTFAVLSADVVVVSVLAVFTGIASPTSWASDVLTQGLFLIPVIAAAQLRPKISAAMAIPAVIAFIASSWISKSINQEPWPPIVLGAAVLCGLSGGSVALSFIQRSRVTMIKELAQQRSQLLDEVLGLEKHERSALSERLHDGALQCVLAARYDLQEVRSGSVSAVDRAESTLTETVHLLRNVVRELHPEVLVRSGLKSAVEQLADSVSDRAKLTIDLDVDGWPAGVHTDLDHILYSAAREIMTNVVKHADARTMRVALSLGTDLARLRISDDGVGISAVDLSRSVEAGHIGLTAVRTKVLAADGTCDITSSTAGTEVTIAIPLRRQL